MKKNIEIPSLGESISEVIIGRLLKSTGAYVQENEEIVEVESEKVNQILYAPASGELHWSVQQGEKCAVAMIIGWVDTEKQPLACPPVEDVAPKVQHPSTPSAPVEKKAVKEPPIESLRQLPPPASVEPSVIKTDEIRKPLSSMRLTIGRRLVKALHEAAMLTTFNEVDMYAVMQLRKKCQEEFLASYGVKLGWMSFFVRAVVDALKAYPEFNAYLDGQDLVLRQNYHIGIAVGTDKGVIVPVLKHADRLALHEIEQQIVKYAQQARQGQLAISDLEGGGFTITNGGVYGSLLSTPILNPPQVGILGMHKIIERPIALNSEVVIRPMMYLALSYDHRVVDGKEAVSFLVHIKTKLEEPARLLF